MSKTLRPEGATERAQNWNLWAVVHALVQNRKAKAVAKEPADLAAVNTSAHATEAKQITPAELNDHLGKCRASRATCIDGRTNQDLRNSPPEARPKLCEIVNRILSTLTIPMQWQVNVIQLLPKPKGGDRPITITSTLYSLVMGLYGIEMTEWQEDQ